MQSTASNTFSSILELQIEQSEKQAELINLQQQINSLCISFNSLLNRESTSKITLPDSIQIDTTFFPVKMDTYRMIQNNPDLLANEQIQEFYTEMIRNTRRNSLPKFALGLHYTFVDKTKRAEAM